MVENSSKHTQGFLTLHENVRSWLCNGVSYGDRYRRFKQKRTHMLHTHTHSWTNTLSLNTFSTFNIFWAAIKRNQKHWLSTGENSVFFCLEHFNSLSGLQLAERGLKKVKVSLRVSPLITETDANIYTVPWPWSVVQTKKQENWTNIFQSIIQDGEPERIKLTSCRILQPLLWTMCHHNMSPASDEP